MTTPPEKRILLVEDQTTITRVVAQQLHRFGYAVASASTGEQAVELATGSGSFDLILMDIELGRGIDGSEAAKQILAKKNIPIIFLSSYTDRATVEKVRGITRYGYVVKNSDEFVLQSTLEMAFELLASQKIKIAFHESEANYSAIIENTSDSIWAVNKSYEITSINTVFQTAFRSAFGIQLLKGMNVLHSLAEPIRPIWQSRYDRTLQNEHCMFEEKIDLDTGAIIVEVAMNPIVMHGDVVGVSCFSRDITERKRSEQRLAEEKERLAVTLRSIGDGVITTDTNGNIVLLNKAAEEMTGWKTDDASGRPLLEVFHVINELTRTACENPVDIILRTGNNIELTNHTALISRDGKERVIADSAAPIRDIENRITGVVLVFRDMTEKQKLTASMQRAQKLESLGILAGGIAHDFNNMLAGIFGYVEMAKTKAMDNATDQIPRYLDKALGIFDRAQGLTQQLLTFSKGGTPVRKTTQIASLIHHSASFALSGSNVSCRFELPEDLWLCDVDENQIGQAIDNLVINAKQAMPSGGTISVSAANVADEPGHDGKFVRMSIQDHGIGMPIEILPNIFDPFFSTKISGHGLGLATVYSIICRHGGWIDVETMLATGSTFHVFIPAAGKTTLPVLPMGPIEHTGAGTILVMDDEEYMREIVGDLLQNMGYSVVLAKDGQEAFALFAEARASSQPFAATILDMTIPGGLGGKETAAAMRTLDPHSILIASSGYSEDPVILNPGDHGFTDRIIKPYRKIDLTEVMARVMPKT